MQEVTNENDMTIENTKTTEKKYDFQKDADRDFPPIVHVETTNICNIKCIHCPQADPWNLVPGYRPETMKFDVWKKVVDEVAEYGQTLRMTPDGETMLLKDWEKFIQYALDKKVKTLTFNTNGLLMEGSKMEVLLQPTDTQIAVEFSMDALWKKSYDEIRKGSDYERFMRNVFNFVYEIRKRKIKNIKTLISCVVQPELEEQEYEMFEKFWEPVVDKVIKRRYVDTKGLTPHKPEVEQVRNFRWPCLVLFTRMVVTYDGKIRFCPDDWQKTTTIGSLEKTSIKDLWRGRAMEHIRKKHIEGDFAKSHGTCKDCTDWKVIEWGNDYTKALNDLFGV